MGNHRVVSQIEVSIEVESDIVDVRQAVRTLCQENGFDAFSQAAIITAASELGRNVWAHAGSGKAIISVETKAIKRGLKLEFIDEGPGIKDVDRALMAGFTTGKSLGLGLPGTKQLMDEFQIESIPGKGTRVTACKWKM